ncbi:tripartite tricarboxylate transporter substrate binding protein [Starkeya sp. ORNL1]|uniref:Bug family tripartite tricarboxylate transporter substrate binding protein n=1 Tax=Starkeya sp. ORNL1 TaxID=2709380 RepID=UPI001463708A|nr:tripartite tricarboxylate transporter substrate-binding protein [Starkeya sp. ORNL1]QJP13261.1 tripartite tricarboxylate transporter substrate binding protein [Starkeya sp. ORNL1]
MPKQVGLLVGLLVAWLSLGANANALDYPVRQIKLVVPFIAGGPVDFLGRVVAKDISQRLGQPVVVDNQSGAGGVIGTEFVARAPADGYTLLLAINSQTFGLQGSREPHLETSFSAISTIAVWSHVLVVRPELPVHSLTELVAYAKANPGALTFGYGLNTPPQLLGETLKRSSGVDIRGIPYRGGAQAVADMLGGRIDMNFGTSAMLAPMVREGKLRAIAYSGAHRTADLPDVPTVTEAGFPQLSFDPDAWAMVLAPTGTPTAVVDALNTAINEGLRDGDVPALLAKSGYIPRTGTAADARAFLAAESRKWPPVAQAAGLKAE